MSYKEPLKDSDIKHGMAIKCGSFGSETVWEVLDRAPQPGQWWIHRRDEFGGWKCIAVHRYEIQIVGDGSRTEHQLALM